MSHDEIIEMIEAGLTRTAAGTQPRLTQAQVKRDLALWAKLEGEFFLLFDDTWALASLRRNPAALSPFIIARPDRVRLIISAAEIQGYEYIDAGGRHDLAEMDVEAVRKKQRLSC